MNKKNKTPVQFISDSITLFKLTIMIWFAPCMLIDCYCEKKITTSISTVFIILLTIKFVKIRNIKYYIDIHCFA